MECSSSSDTRYALKDVTKDIREGDTITALLAESGIRERHADLANRHLVQVESEAGAKNEASSRPKSKHTGWGRGSLN